MGQSHRTSISFPCRRCERHGARLPRYHAPRRTSQVHGGDDRRFGIRGVCGGRLEESVSGRAGHHAPALIAYLNKSSVGRRHLLEHLGDLRRGQIDHTTQDAVDLAAGVPDRRGDDHVRPLEDDIRGQHARDDALPCGKHRRDGRVIDQRLPQPREPGGFRP